MRLFPLCMLSSAALAVFLSVSGSRAASRHVVLMMGGDVQWSLTLRPPTILFDVSDPNDPDWRPSPHVYRSDRTGASARREHDQYAIRYGLRFSSERDMLSYPLRRLEPALHAADLVFFNLETPLSDTARMDGEARTPEKFAVALKSAGASVVTIANNHTFDTQGVGFLDTLRSLSQAGLPYIGGGRDLAEARKPVILERNGIRTGFIGYAQFSNMGEPAFAAEGRPGIAPMDPVLMEEDIRALRPRVEVVAVSIHWGNDKSANVSPVNRALAHRLIDAGADIILGHHSPIPKGIEVYRGKVIVYSPGHVAIGHNHPEWGDSYLVRFTIGSGAVEKLEVLPIAGTGQQLAQPFLLEGDPAKRLIERVRDLSATLDTRMDLEGDQGVIRVGTGVPKQP